MKQTMVQPMGDISGLINDVLDAIGVTDSPADEYKRQQAAFQQQQAALLQQQAAAAEQQARLEAQRAAAEAKQSETIITVAAIGGVVVLALVGTWIAMKKK